MGRNAAVVDVGSNTVRLVVADCSSTPPVETYTDRVRLGLGREIEASGGISEPTIAEAADVVAQLVADARARNVDSLDIFITAPGRQAENAPAFVEAIERKARTAARVLSAEEEARLAFAGAVTFAAPDAKLVAVVDLGGASTEFAVGRPETGPAWWRSVDLGALNLTTRFFETENPDRAAVDAAQEAVAEAFAGLAPPLPEVALAIGGSARALGRMLGPRLGRGELAAAASLLPVCAPDAVANAFDIGKTRTPLLLAASLILMEAQRRLVVPLTVTAGGVREGALLLGAREAAAA